MRFRLGATVTRADVPVLCADLAAALHPCAGDPAGPVLCDVSAVVAPDLVTVEAIARLRLTARRHGRRLEITGAGHDLWRLIALVGLGRVLAEGDPRPRAGSDQQAIAQGGPQPTAEGDPQPVAEGGPQA
ncbi:hypothetical protein Val02_03900 [Virgisporangium aliadipatigenens]|uniref:MlaB-like STAS domain-containing protein n=1 Tax=Virgisporangium aliadipatigenens TaxID=741659 RepID=A0A8J3YE93_9ACTN|nr:STAS domain-containing protein [Virgisporangium aliadipatigenens]GIJ43504.1 hypothetical protein Val02_03900 [Virgisporangium aliadipatigenens]